MAYHGILIPEQIAALNIDSYNRSAIMSGSTVDNGYIVALASGKSATDGESEVFTATVPATGSLTGLWMVYQGDEVVVTDSRYKGLDPDVRNFYVAAGKVFSVYKPQVGDIITVTADALSGSIPSAAYTFINATDSTMKLTWGTSQTASVLSYKLLATTYISLATGAIDSQRVTAYEFECVAI